MRRGGGEGTRSLGSRVWRYRLTNGELSRADAPAQLFAAVYDRRSAVTVFGTTQAFLDAQSCGAASCDVRRPDGTPSFRFVRVVEAPRRSCGDVGYTPNTDHGAFRITAEGTSCAVARSIARDAEGKPQTFTTRGYTCTGTRREGGLPSTRFTCRNGERRVTFSRS